MKAKPEAEPEPKTKANPNPKHRQLLCDAINKAITSFWSISLRVTAAMSMSIFYDAQPNSLHTTANNSARHKRKLSSCSALKYATIVYACVCMCVWCLKAFMQKFVCLTSNTDALAISFLAMANSAHIKLAQCQVLWACLRIWVWLLTARKPSTWWQTIKWPRHTFAQLPQLARFAHWFDPRTHTHTHAHRQLEHLRTWVLSWPVAWVIKVLLLV